jgi:pyrroline-5-carboxylate reductase
MKIAMIGCGMMGSTLARQLAKKSSLTIYSRTQDKVKALASEIGAKLTASASEAVSGADVVILAVKPKDFQKAASSFSLTKDQILFSVLTGVSLPMLRKTFPEGKLVRMMPNTALSVGKGIIGFAEEGDLGQVGRSQVEALFKELGLLLWVPDEKMEAFAAHAASSPAFVFLLMEAMVEAGVYLGFSSHESFDIVLSVFEGCVQLLKESKKSPALLKSEITSPGGTTIEGIKALEEKGVRAALFNALEETWLKGLRMKAASEKGP